MQLSFDSLYLYSGFHNASCLNAQQLRKEQKRLHAVIGNVYAGILYDQVAYLNWTYTRHNVEQKVTTKHESR